MEVVIKDEDWTISAYDREIEYVDPEKLPERTDFRTVLKLLECNSTISKTSSGIPVDKEGYHYGVGYVPGLQKDVNEIIIVGEVLFRSKNSKLVSLIALYSDALR
jgi:hypothetical protein